MNQPDQPHTGHDRYPGPRSFTDTDADRRLFFGRDQEIESLAHRVRAARMLVLFGRSGQGKTSLLQAGLYPRLRGFDFLPIPVRFDRPGIDPVQTVIEATLSAASARGLDAVPGERDGLWLFFRTTDLWDGDTLLTPVLVFDQFEEVFTRQQAGFRQALAAELGALASRGLPEAVHRMRADGRRLPFKDAPPDLRVIMSLREEYLGSLDEFAARVPAILETRFRLAPLRESNASGAIEAPAAVPDDGVFHSRPFTYEQSALDEMLGFLTNRAGEVEPFQLQVLCRHLERQVILRQRKGETNVRVDQRLLGGRDAMTAVLANLYADSLAGIAGRGQRRRARRLCECGLISTDGKRLSLEEGSLRREFKLRPDTLSTLMKTRLLRKDNRPGLEGFYYELSHDSLVAPIQRVRAKSRRALRAVAAAPAIVLAIIAGFVGESLLWANSHNLPLQAVTTLWKYKLGGAVPMPTMKEVPKGQFDMGSDDSPSDNERPVHTVTIPKPFYLATTETTFAQYDAFAAATLRKPPSDSGWGRENRPVVNVDWDNARAYAAWLSAMTGVACRLPSEAEWEYAARARTKTRYALPRPGGSDNIKGQGIASCNHCGHDSDGKNGSTPKDGTTPVGQFHANAWGLNDMHGNVWEWTEDCWHDNYAHAPIDGRPWLEENRGECRRRVARGGSWVNNPGVLRSAHRLRHNPSSRDHYLGFRVVCSSVIADH